MNKRLLVALSSLFFVAGLNSCTSKDSKSEMDSDVVSASDVEQVDSEAPLTIDSSESPEIAETLPESAPSDTLTITDTPASETVIADSSTTMNVDPTPEFLTETPVEATSTPETTDEMAQQTEPVITDSQASVDPITETPVMEESTPSAPVEEVMAAPVVEKPKVAAKPLLKVASAPYMVNNKWVNAVYLARPKDTLKSISKMIYGENKVKELKKINTQFTSRNVKPGDKVYYNSPQRPEDSSRIATYYEDNGIAAETYVAQKGDNIRKVSKKLLGYENAWMEVWATNNVESKASLSEGETLRYWPVGVVTPPAPVMAKTETVMPPPPSQTEASMPPSPDMAMNSNALPPPPPMEQMPSPPTEMTPPPPPPAMDQAAMPPPPPMEQMPPPPPMEMAPPADPLPPPPVDHMADNSNGKEGVSEEETAISPAMDIQSIGLLGGIGLLSGALVFMMIRRRQKAKAMAQNIEEHNVGT